MTDLPDRPGRWSRRIVRPRLTLTSSDPAAVVVELAAALQRRGFSVRPEGAGFKARRRPWFDWLAGSVQPSCVLTVTPGPDGRVEVDVEQTGGHPAPTRVGDALADALHLLTDRGVVVTCGTWVAAVP